MARAGHPRRSRAVLLVLSAAASLALLEGGAHLVERIGTGSAVAKRIDDLVLEYRTMPDAAGHDGRGYRNGATLDRADVVALGDSQTWGENAALEGSWPARLAATTGRSVYNMGRGGYGALQYVAQLDEALALEPEVVVVALYFGNDFYDAYDLAYRFEAHAAWRHPEPDVRARIVRSEYPDLKRMLFARLQYERQGFDAPRWLRERTAIGRLAARALFPVDAHRDRAWAEDHPEEGFVYEARGVSTVFHTTYRLAAVDLRLPRIAEGVRITEAALSELARRVGREKLLILLLPTKERVFEAAVATAGTRTPPSYAESLAFERQIEERLVAFMSARGIAHIAALPALERAVAGGEEIFPPNGDGHFNAAGYALIARVVADALASQ